jgi:glutamate synthase (NADPH/NADH) large chain
MLDDWATWLPKFKKVMPVDYRRALMEMQAEQEKAKTAA